MNLDDKAKKVVDLAQEGYAEAEGKVDGWFARNKYTVVILSGVAFGIACLAIAFLYCVTTHG